MKKIELARNDSDINACCAVMTELRPHLEPEEFFQQVKRQAAASGYQLAYLSDGEIRAVAGFRIAEWLAGGKYLEIEDLATKSGDHSKGFGGELFDWLVEFARKENCAQIKLVSRVDRFGAHRFYLNRRMIIEAHYFSLKLN